MKNIFYVKVNGRTFETTESEDRKNELLEILPDLYPGREITAEEKVVVDVRVKYEAIFTYEIPADEFDDFYALPEAEVDLDLDDIGCQGNKLQGVYSRELEAEVID